MNEVSPLAPLAASTQSPARRAKRILIGTVGGQGGGVLSDWLVHGLLNAGWRATSIGLLGLSQRAGTVTYYCEAIPGQGKAAIASVFATPGDVDLLIGQEFLELGRLVFGGFAAPGCSIIGNSARYLTTMEKMPGEDGIYDPAVIAKAVEALAPGRHYIVDSQRLVLEAGLPLLTSNALLLGAAIASPAFDLARDSFHEAIRESEVNVKANIAAFDLGYDRVKDGSLPRMMVGGAKTDDAGELARKRRAQLRTAQRPVYDQLLGEAGARHGEALQGVFAEALYRLLDYQDAAYARDYLARLERLAARPGIDHETLLAYAKHLSNWMTYEDIARVAQLKTRPERFARIRREFGVTNQRYVVTDYLVPDMEQLLGGLPKPLAAILAAGGRAVARNFESWKFPMQVKTSGATGFTLMRGIAGLRVFRRHSGRYEQEQAALARWEAAVTAMAARGSGLGRLAAEAGRLVKGYGRVRRDALADLWAFLDEALPRLADRVRNDAKIDEIAGKALKILSKEAGSATAMRSYLAGEAESLAGEAQTLPAR